MVLLMGRKENWKGRDRRSFKILQVLLFLTEVVGIYGFYYSLNGIYIFYKVFCMYDSLSIYTICSTSMQIELPSFYIFIDIPTPLAQMPQSLDYNSRLPDITCVLGHHSAAKVKIQATGRCRQLKQSLQTKKPTAQSSPITGYTVANFFFFKIQFDVHPVISTMVTCI